MAGDDRPVAKRSDNSEVAAFLNKLAATPNARPAGQRGRLLFGMDATASREPSWDTACQIQGDMFAETAALGGLDVQLVFYRGHGDFRATPWVSSSADLIPYMTRVRCLGGHTQLQRLLNYAAKEAGKHKIDALVFVGDCLEEKVDDVCAAAGELAMRGVPCFMFHEGGDTYAAKAFRQIATITKGAFCRFDSASPAQLKALLSAVAVYAAGGRKALADYSRGRGGEVKLLASQLGGGRAR
jgi:hypothetical protein